MDNQKLVNLLKELYEEDRNIMVSVDAGLLQQVDAPHPIELIKREASLIQELLYLNDIKETQLKAKWGNKDVKTSDTAGGNL